jgi:hypothetical protein
MKRRERSGVLTGSNPSGGKHLLQLSERVGDVCIHQRSLRAAIENPSRTATYAA